VTLRIDGSGVTLSRATNDAGGAAQFVDWIAPGEAQVQCVVAASSATRGWSASSAARVRVVARVLGAAGAARHAPEEENGSFHAPLSA
jgi:hypothetical protein